MPAAPHPLATGAEVRVTNGIRERTVVLVNGGRAQELPGTWSATLEWLVGQLAPRFPSLGFVEVKYLIKSWRRLELCVEDGRAALAAAVAGGAERCALVGFSMGGAVAVRAADDPVVRSVVGLSPWLPDRLALDALAQKRFAIIHGALDRGLPGIPGVTAASSRRALDRAREAGVVDAEYTLIRGGVHGTALRAPWGLSPLPRARRWADALARELELFERA